MPRAKPVWTLDSETDPFKPGRIPLPFVWGLYGGPTGEEYHVFDTADEVVAFLRDKPHVVYAHNGGKFADYHCIREHINTMTPVTIIAGRLSKFFIGECEFRDSINILPVSLATFKKDDVDYSIFEADERDKPHNRKIILDYLRSDCKYLYELIEEHRKENGIVLTQAGASMRAWSKQSKLKPPRQSQGCFRLYQPYYYGGRVQDFCKDGEPRVVKRDFKVIDINSAYPKAMMFPHPFSVQGTMQERLPKESEIHKCLITLTCTARGCFPLRITEGRDKGQLFYPWDEKTVRRYHVTGYEFLAALRHDAIRNVTIETVHHFTNSVKFEEFIQKHWDRRAQAKREGNKALEIIIKLLMNSLYGKFASDYAKYREYVVASTDEFELAKAKGFERDTNWGNGLWLMSKPIAEDRHRYYNMATAASITGYVRAQLFEALQQVSNPIYCDTDSIACVDTAQLTLGDGLGEWKVEGEFDEYWVVGKKTYCFHKKGAPYSEELDEKKNYANYKVACKGVDLTPSEIRRIANGEVVTYHPEVPTYSVKAMGPKFTSRDVRVTGKDISRVRDAVERKL